MEENKSLSPMQRYNRYITNPATQDYLQSVLNENKNAFIISLTSLVGSDVKLQNCVPSSVMYAAIKATSLGFPLDNNLGFAYVIPYRDKKSGLTYAQLQIGWHGYYQLAIRTGKYTAINVTTVCEGYNVVEDVLTGKISVYGEKTSDNVIGYLAYFKMVNGLEKAVYWTKSRMMDHAERYSQSRDSGVWKTNFDEMGKKTVIKQLLKHYGDLSDDLRRAIESDQVVIDGNNKESYMDNPATQLEQAQNEKAAAIFADAMGVTDIDYEETPADDNLKDELFN